MDKVVLKLDLHDDKQKQKAMMAVSCLSGVESISMDMKERTLTVIGDVDPVTVVSKLRKSWPSTKIVSVGPAKEPEKKEDGKKDDGKKVDGKKDDGKKEDSKKDDEKEDGKKDDGKKKMDEKKVSVGLAKESEKKKDDGKKEEDGKKDDGKEDGKKEDGKKDDGNKEDGKKKVSNEQYHEFMRTYGYRAPAYTPYHAYSDEENPNTCVIS